MLNRKVLGLGFALAIAISAIPAQAHHSFSATFTDETITVEGYVEEMSFSNPHVIVYFNVTDDNGQEKQWMTEGGAATLLRRQGWSNTTLNEGDYIRVTGNSTRNGSPMVSMGTLNFVNPVSGAVIGSPGTDEFAAEETVTIPMQLEDGLPNLTGAWTMGAGGRRGAGGPPGAGGGPPGGGGGPPGGGGGPGRGGPSVPLNEVGAALQAEYDPVNDPQVQCEPPGLVRQAATTPHPVRIEQFDDHVVISYEEYGSVRTIYFDDRDIGSDEKTHLGQSIARYEGQKLIIESTHLLANLTGPNGNAITDQTTTVETYYREEDADGSSSLKMDMVVTDPGHLSEPWTLSWQKYYGEGYSFIEVDCHKPLAY